MSTGKKILGIVAAGVLLGAAASPADPPSTVNPAPNTAAVIKHAETQPVMMDTELAPSVSIVPEVEEVEPEVEPIYTAPAAPVVPIVEKSEPTPEPVAPTPTPTPVKTTPPPAPVTNTTPTSNCHPNYSGCLRADASDYDCADGSGNGPYYTDKVQVYGADPFGLDRDKDGWGCE